MMTIVGILLGMILSYLIKKAWKTFQLREMKRMAGLLRPKDISREPGKWGKRFKYLHNFLEETRFHLGLQTLYLKKDFLKFCLKHNVFNFKASPLGKCLQASVDAETAVLGEGNSLEFFHVPFLVEFKHYLYGITHPDPVVYGGQRFGKGKRPPGRVDTEQGRH